jgi:hypothetical protein
MIFKRANRANIFSSRLQFKADLDLETGKFYELEFDYLINLDVCDVNQLNLVVYLFDAEDFQEVLFETTTNVTTTLVNMKWTKHKDCFQVLGRIYKLVINAISTCNIANHDGFVAVDHFFIRELNDENLESVCQDQRVTVRPSVEVPQEITSTAEVEQMTSESSSLITTIQVESEEISTSKNL